MICIFNGEYFQIKICQGDIVVFFVNFIFGNIIVVVNIIDCLMMQGVNVIYGKYQGIYVFGYVFQEEYKMLLVFI